MMTPEEREKQALSNYLTARNYEINFYNTTNAKSALIAIDLFEKYYRLTPNGEYAALSLLRKAELLYRIGNIGMANQELIRLKQRKDFSMQFSEEINYIQNLIYKK